MKLNRIELLGILLSLVFLKVFIWLAKFIIQSPRPPSAELWFYNPSFPSGVAADSSLVACILSSKFPRYTILFHLLGVEIGWSRVYTGMHYPVDVFGGYLLGLIWFVFIHKKIINWLQ